MVVYNKRSRDGIYYPCTFYKGKIILYESPRKSFSRKREMARRVRQMSKRLGQVF